MTIGYNFNEYVNFISRRLECYYAVIGIIVMILSLILGGKKDELYI